MSVGTRMSIWMFGNCMIGGLVALLGHLTNTGGLATLAIGAALIIGWTVILELIQRPLGEDDNW